MVAAIHSVQLCLTANNALYHSDVMNVGKTVFSNRFIIVGGMQTLKQLYVSKYNHPSDDKKLYMLTL